MKPIHPVTNRHPLKPTTTTYETWQEALEAYARVGEGRLEERPDELAA